MPLFMTSYCFSPASPCQLAISSHIHSDGLKPSDFFAEKAIFLTVEFVLSMKRSVILCLAVLSVLTIATAHSSLVLAQRQATATQELYRNETAAQAFMAEVDRVLTAPGGNSAANLNGQLVALCSTAEAAAGGDVKATAQMVGQTIRADFSSQNGRTLKIALTIQPDGTYRVDSWRMVAVVNDEQPIGNLYLSEPNG